VSKVRVTFLRLNTVEGDYYTFGKQSAAEIVAKLKSDGWYTIEHVDGTSTSLNASCVWKVEEMMSTRRMLRACSLEHLRCRPRRVSHRDRLS
jgi:hypothetical protein